MMPDIIGKPHTWCYKFLGWRLKLTKSAFRRISQLKLVPAPGHWSGRHCLGCGCRSSLQDPWPLRILAWRLRRQAACSAAVICLACSASPITLNTHHAYEDFATLERVHWWCSLLQGRVFRGGYCSLWLQECVQVLRAAVCLVPAVLLPLLQAAGRHRRLQCLARPAAVPV